MKGDKLGTVSRIPAGRPGQPGSRGAAENPRIKGIWRERGSGRPAPAGLPPRGPRRPGVGDCRPRAGTPGFPACPSRGLRRRPLRAARPGGELRRARGSQRFLLPAQAQMATEAHERTSPSPGHTRKARLSHQEALTPHQGHQMGRRGARI
nr:cuticle collagen 7-like isoform X3 [Symphalangus syndactylus]